MINNKPFVITYYSASDKKTITRNALWTDKCRYWISKNGRTLMTYFDVDQDGASTYGCNGNVFLVSSMAAICTPLTCQNGGTCVAAGLSFTCSCPAGFHGALCENEHVLTHCTQFNCDQAGGHLSNALGAAGNCDASDPCTVAKCCAASDPADFSQVCAGLEASGMTEDYINIGCCLAC